MIADNGVWKANRMQQDHKKKHSVEAGKQGENLASCEDTPFSKRTHNTVGMRYCVMEMFFHTTYVSRNLAIFVGPK